MKKIKPNNLITFIYSIYSWIIVVLGFVSHFIYSCLFRWFFKDREYATLKFAKPFIRGMFFFTGIKIKTQGLDNLKIKEPFIIMSNHQGLLDVLTYILIISQNFAFIPKKQLLNVPIIGWGIRLQGHITIDREHAHAASQQIQVLKSTLQKKRSLLFFPEGTRSSNGELLPFKRGGFILAQNLGIPIIPAYIETYKVNRKKSLAAYINPIKVNIGKAISVTQNANPTKKETQLLIEETRNTILSLKASI